MASVVNRSPYRVVPKGAKNTALAKSFRSRKAAEAYLAELSAGDVPAKLNQDPAGPWEAIVRVVGADGKRHDETRTFDSEADARGWAVAEEAKLKGLRSIGASVSSAKTRFEDAVKEWYDERGIHLAGKDVIKYNLPKVINGIGASRPMDEVSVAVLRSWRDGLQKEGYAPSTVANFRQIVSGTFNYWVSEKDFPGGNPTQLVTWKKPDNVKTPPTLPSVPKNGQKKSDEARLFEAIDARSPWLRLVVEWGIETAMRRGEIAAMEWEHFDFDEQKLRIPHTKNDWRKDNTVPKGRELPLWPALIAILDRVQPDPKKRTGKVFQGTPSSYTHSFAECVKQAGLTELTFHSLRKIATSRLSKKLPNVAELSKITAHESLEVLAKVYYGVELKELAEKISGSHVSLEERFSAVESALRALFARGGDDAKTAKRLAARLSDIAGADVESGRSSAV
jgi:integrase